MADTQYDFAILGGSPLAALMALRLAENGARTLIAGHRKSPLQLTRGMDVGAGAITRPETWAALLQGERKATGFINRHFPRATSRITLSLATRSARGAQTLGHIRHMAAAFGVSAETGNGDGCSALVHMHGVARLDRRAVYRGLARALAEAGVATAEAMPDRIARMAGKPIFAVGDDLVAANSITLAGNAAAPLVGELGHSGLLQVRDAHALLTLPEAPVRWPHVIDIDSGSAVQTFDNGQIEILHPGSHEAAMTALSGMLVENGETDVIGASQFGAVLTTDGAPVVRASSGNAPGFVFGFEPFGAFMAVSIADYLMGQADTGTSAYLDRLGPAKRKHVADISSAGAIA